MAESKFTAQQMIDAIRAKNGILSSAARMLGCSRSAIYRAIEKYPTVKEAYQEATETVLDLAESKLFSAVNEGQLPAVFFLLRTKGRSRGYADYVRQEVTGPGGGPLQHQQSAPLDLSKLTDEELATLEAIYHKAGTVPGGNQPDGD